MFGLSPSLTLTASPGGECWAPMSRQTRERGTGVGDPGVTPTDRQAELVWPPGWGFPIPPGDPLAADT